MHPIIEDICSLTPLQEGMLYHHLANPTIDVYVSQFTYSLEGDWQKQHFEAGINALVAKYQVLRTVFAYEKISKPQQVILKERKVEVYDEDISEQNTTEQQAYLQLYSRTDLQRGFDLSADCLLRLSVFKTGQQVYKLVVTHHHIILDGWSFPLLINDFIQFCQLAKQQKPLITTPTPSYSSYINWLKKQPKQPAIAYWQDYLDGYEETADLPKTVNKADVKHQHEEHNLCLKKETTANLQALAVAHNTTLSIVFDVIWGLVLQRYSGKEDVVFGRITSGRPAELDEVEKIVGMFINSVPQRISRQACTTFAELLEKVRNERVQMQSYEYIGLAEIQQQSPFKDQLINHLVVFENYPVSNNADGGKADVKLSLDKGIEQTNYDFNVIVVPGEELFVKLDYNPNRYDKAIVCNIVSYLQQLAQLVSEEPDVPLESSRLFALLPEEQVVLQQANDTQAPFLKDKTIGQLFEEHVGRTPEAIAVIFENKQLSYQQLNEKANQLARVLIAKGVKVEEPVALLVERSLEMVVAILGVLKAGGCYVPIDAGYPEDRIRYVLEDSGAKLLLSNVAAAQYENMVEVVAVGDEALYRGEATNVASPAGANNLAYIIYTSGTTGRPKGVMVEHSNVINLISWHNQKFAVTASDRATQLASPAFDASVWEMWPYLTAGASLCLVQQDLLYAPKQLQQWLSQQQITICFVPTPLAEQLLRLDWTEQCSNLRYLLMGGDRWQGIDHGSFGATLVNNYGPTEATVVATMGIVIERGLAKGAPSIGGPIANTQVYILDEHTNLKPIGVVGEICVGGAGVARGYLNREGLTKEKFIENPFGKGRLYRTGDLGRWLADGSIEYIGRKDDQVKIRGYRIELGEIEQILLTHPQLKEAVVVARQKEGSAEKYLCAYYTCPIGESTDVEVLRLHISKQLPEYMIPLYFVQLPELPLSTNGKINRKTLPEPDKKQGVKEYIAPANETENKLAHVWQGVLEVEKVSREDSFFLLGGDSIKAIQVISRLQQHGLKLTVTHLMQHPVLKDAALYLEAPDKVVDQGLVTGEVKLTPIQRWFFEQNFMDPLHWNFPWTLFDQQGFEEAYLQQVLDALVLQHDALRMVFREESGQRVQYNRGKEGQLYELRKVDVRGLADAANIIEQVATELQSSLDLANGPLVKVGLFKTDSGDHLLLVVHHLVIDGVSWRILLEDFTTAYGQLRQGKRVQLPPKTTSFSQWSRQLYTYAVSAPLQEEFSYWEKVERQLLNNASPKVAGTQADVEEVEFRLTTQQTAQLQHEVHQAYQTQINDILLAGFGLAMRKWSGQSLHVILLEGHGREEVIEGVDLTRTVGWFTTQYPFVLEVPNGEDLSYQVRHIKEQLRKVPHKGIGYGLWKYGRNDKASTGIHPAISFNYLGEFAETHSIDTENKQQHYSFGSAVSDRSALSFSLNLNGMIQQGRLEFSCQYNSRQYTFEQIKQLMEGFHEQMLQVINHCTSKEGIAFTPSDYGTNSIDIEELNDLEDSLFDI